MGSVRPFLLFGVVAGVVCLCLSGVSYWVIRSELSDKPAPMALVDAPKAVDVPPSTMPAEKNVTDRALTSWSVELRERLASGGKATVADQVSLEKIVRDSPLSSQQLMTKALSIRRFCADDNIIGVLFAAVVRKGDQELRQYAPGAAEAKPILVAMNRTKNTLWRMPDGPDHTYINVLLLLFNDSIGWISPRDPELQLDLYQAYNGRAECLMLRGELDQALAASEAIPQSQVITDAEKGSQAYSRSLILIRMSRDLEAVSFLHVAARLGDRQETAQRILVDELCKIGRGTDAKTEYVDFVRRFHPPPEQVQEYRDKVVVALADEEGKSQP